MNSDNVIIKKAILETFLYEEETIFHVMNYLNQQGFHINREAVKGYLSEFLMKQLIEIYDDPSGGQIKFQDSLEQFEEDYWFVLTPNGKKELNLSKDNLEKEINSAIDECIGLWWSDKTEELIEKKFGGRLLNIIKDVYNYALKYDIDWGTNNMQEALIKLERDMIKKYPYLESKSINRLKNCFAYSWK